MRGWGGIRARLGGGFSVAAAAAISTERGRSFARAVTAGAISRGSAQGFTVAAAAVAGIGPGKHFGTVAQCEATSSAAASGLKPEVAESLPPSMLAGGPGKNTFRLYQYESCPFCRKVRASLDYLKVPYEIVEVNPLSKAETKAIAPDYKKVPVLVVEGEKEALQLRDSKTIVRSLLADKNPGVLPSVPVPKATPSTGKMWIDVPDNLSAEEQWVLWTDKVLAQCLVMNVYRTLTESSETFKYLFTHPAFPWYAQYSASIAGTSVMYMIAKRRKKKYEVEDARQAMYEACNLLAESAAHGKGKFLGGDKPGAADFNAYGILRAAEGCQTERDIASSCPSIAPWFDAMREIVGPSCALNAGDIKRG
mmetsp:Transcript_64523/g.120058  ORF Transcript_64523/g.120058 Transcript_64523/m.120058 type:complete len:365 (-) Transcript_64523:113-1207(-)